MKIFKTFEKRLKFWINIMILVSGNFFGKFLENFEKVTVKGGENFLKAL